MDSRSHLEPEGVEVRLQLMIIDGGVHVVEGDVDEVAGDDVEVGGGLGQQDLDPVERAVDVRDVEDSHDRLPGSRRD